MATVLCHVNIVSRGSGHSAVAGAAYRAGEKIRNDVDGVSHNYSRRKDVVYAEILKPDHAPDWAGNRSRLWNEVERIEKQCNSQLARQIEIALPRELTKEQNIELARDYASVFVQQGMVADLTLHDEYHNPHAHLMLTMRPFNPDGTWGSKAKKEYILDEHGNRIRLSGGEWKSRRVNTTDWDNRDNVERWREWYATITNHYLEKYGHEQRIDHRSFERQGLEQTPTLRINRKSWEMEQRGIHTVQGDINREIQEKNRQRKAINQQLDELNRQKEEILAGQEKKEEVKESPAQPLHGIARYQQDSSFDEKVNSHRKLETVIQRESGQQDSSFEGRDNSQQMLETVTQRESGQQSQLPRLVRDPNRHRRYDNRSKEAQKKKEQDKDRGGYERETPSTHTAVKQRGVDRYRQLPEQRIETTHSPPRQRRSSERYHERVKRQPLPKLGKDHEQDF